MNDVIAILLKKKLKIGTFPVKDRLERYRKLDGLSKNNKN